MESIKIRCYCPICKNREFKEVEVDRYGCLRIKCITNIRDGYGRCLYHFPCSKCGSLTNATTSDWFDYKYDTLSEKAKEDTNLYFEEVIDMYGVEDYGADFRKWAEDRWKEITEEKK